jgi:hypothetical protein
VLRLDPFDAGRDDPPGNGEETVPLHFGKRGFPEKMK